MELKSFQKFFKIWIFDNKATRQQLCWVENNASSSSLMQWWKQFGSASSKSILTIYEEFNQLQPNWDRVRSKQASTVRKLQRQLQFNVNPCSLNQKLLIWAIRMLKQVVQTSNHTNDCLHCCELLNELPKFTRNLIQMSRLWRQLTLLAQIGAQRNWNYCRSQFA